MRKSREQFAGDRRHALVAQVLERKIDQVEIDPFGEEPRRRHHRRFGGSGEALGNKGLERGSLIQLPDGFDPAEIAEMRFCHTFCSLDLLQN